MQAEGGLKRRLNRTFLLQAAAIGVAAVVSVYLAAVVIKRVLVTEALRNEATFFWERRAVEAGFPPPRTRNLTGYLVGDGGDAKLPAELRGMTDGFHDLPAGRGFTTVYVTSRDTRRLYLLFDGERVNELAAFFGLVPLAVVLLVLYLSVWLAYRASQRAVSPITRLAAEVNRLDPDAPSPAPFAAARLPPDADAEVIILAAALERFAERLAAFVERERHFTRDVSHELRTPLTVIRVATDTLRERADLTRPVRDALARIARSARDMEDLVEAFLLLARETERGLPVDHVCVNDLIAAELEQLELIGRGKPVKVELDAACRLWVEGPEKALSALLGNLLRNAFAYTEAGTIRVVIEPRGVIIEDSGTGFDQAGVATAFEPFSRGATAPAGGHGVGLTIVRRFSERFGWPVAFSSRPGTGTRVRVDFPAARCDAAPAPPG